MDAVPSPRHTRTVVVLAAVAVACLLALLVADPGTSAFAVVRGFATGIALLTAGGIITAAAPGSSWPGARALGVALMVAGAAAVAFGCVGLISDLAFEPHLADVILLALLVPFLAAAKQEFAAHFDPPYRREVIADVTVLAFSLSAIAYVAIKPIDASPAAAISAITYAILGSTIVAIFGALALWVPSRAHVLLFVGLGRWRLRRSPSARAGQRIARSMRRCGSPLPTSSCLAPWPGCCSP